jgi:hypothetical protein
MTRPHCYETKQVPATIEYSSPTGSAAGWWGGYGFIYLPRGTGGLHPALARVLAAYDPDYIVDALWTHPDIETLEPTIYFDGRIPAP